MRRVRFAAFLLLLVAVTAAPASAATPRIAVKPARVVEGDAVGKIVRVRLTLNRRAPAGAWVRYRARTGSAGARDFTSRSGRVRFRRGSRRAAIVLRIRSDQVAEGDERFTVRLFRARRLRLGPVRTVTVTIVDDDGPTGTPGGPLPGTEPVTAGIADASVAEPAAAGATASHGLALVLSRPATAEIKVDYEIVGAGTATAEDIDLVRGTATFGAGETRKALPGSLRGDDLDELPETVTVRLSSPVNTLLPDPEAALTITDDPGDVPPSLSIADVTVTEGVGPARLSATLSAPSGRAITVGYSTEDGTADAGDRPAASGTLTIEPGKAGGVIELAVTNDPRDEDAQAFGVSLAPVDGATVADGEATVTIEDDDAPPTVSIDDVTRQEEHVAATFTVTLSAASEKTVTMRADTASVTASGGASCGPGVDYVVLANTPLTFAPGTLTKTLDVQICEDGVDENVETATVQLAQLANATASDLSGTLAITNDD